MKLQIIFSTLFITVSFWIISAKSSQANPEKVVRPSVHSQRIEIPSKIVQLHVEDESKCDNIGCSWAPDDVEVSRPIRKRTKKKSTMQGGVQMQKRVRAKALEAEVMMPSNIRSAERQDDEMRKSEEIPNNMNELSVGKLNIIDPDDDTQPQATPKLQIITPNLQLPKIHITR
mgnify:FL=1